MTLLEKSILSLPLTGLVILGFLSAFELLGRKDKRFRPQHLRLVHRVNGYAFFILSLFLSYHCLKIMRGTVGELSARAALHGLLAVGVFLFLALKILIIRFYKQYFSMVPSLGVAVIMLALGTVATSAGYYFTMRGGGVLPVAREGPGDRAVEKGALIFQKDCAGCHYADRSEAKIGPGLYRLFKREKLPSTGRAATEDNVRKQITDPVNVMPAFKDYMEEEMKALMAFIKGL